MVILNAKDMADRAALHAQLKAALRLPDYYGENLDALNDCLGERASHELVVIQNAGELLRDHGVYAAKLLEVFNDNGVQVLLD